MNDPGYWKREDGQPWGPVESLPRPPSVISAQSAKHYPWQSLESLPTPLDAGPKNSSATAKEGTVPKAKEDWSFQNLKVDDEEEKQEIEKQWIATPLSPTKPRNTTCPVVEEGVESVRNVKNIPLDRFPAIPRSPARDRSPTFLPPPPWPYPGLLYSDSLRGDKWQGSGQRGNNRPPTMPLSNLVEQLFTSAPAGDPQRKRRGNQRPVSPLSQELKEPNRTDFHIAGVGYMVRKETLYAEKREVGLPKLPIYLSPIDKKTRHPLQGRWECEERHTRTHSRQRLCGSYGRPPAPTINPFLEEQAHLWPRDKYQSLISNYPNGPSYVLRAGNPKKLMKKWEDPGSVKMSKRRKTERKKDKTREYSFLHAGGRDGEGKKPNVDNQDAVEEYVHVDTGPRYGERDAPRSKEEAERPQLQRSRERLQRDFMDSHDIDDHSSIHYPPASSRAFNGKRIRNSVLRILGDSSKKDKIEDKAPAMDGEDTESIYGASEAEVSSSLKKLDPYASFIETTGRHPRHFHKSRMNPDEVFDRFVLDCRPLAESEEEPTENNKRRPMIDMVNLKTGERTRRKIRGYDKLPRTIKIAAGIEMAFGGLPPRNASERGRGGRKKKKKKDGCAVM